MAYYVPPSENVRGHVPRVRNQMAPMRESIVLLPEDIILCVSTEPAMPATFDSRECVKIEWSKFPEIFAERMVSEKIQPTRFLSLIIICRITQLITRT